MKLTNSVPARAIALSLTLGFAIVGCGTSTEAGGESPSPEQTDGPATFEADYQPAEDISALADQSDTVVVGEVVGREPGRVIQGLGFDEFTIAVSEVLSGELPGDDIVFETAVHDGDVDIELHGSPTPSVGDRGVWFVTRVGEEFGGEHYMPTTPQGVIIVDGEGFRGGGDDPPLLEDLARFDSLDDLADHVRSR